MKLQEIIEIYENQTIKLGELIRKSLYQAQKNNGKILLDITDYNVLADVYNKMEALKKENNIEYDKYKDLIDCDELKDTDIIKVSIARKIIKDHFIDRARVFEERHNWSIDTKISQVYEKDILQFSKYANIIQIIYDIKLGNIL